MTIFSPAARPSESSRMRRAAFIKLKSIVRGAWRLDVGGLFPSLGPIHPISVYHEARHAARASRSAPRSGPGVQAGRGAVALSDSHRGGVLARGGLGRARGRR